MTSGRYLIGALVLAFALGSGAMSLGRTKGAAWVGRPLDVGVQVKFDSGEDSASTCFAVDVLYGDTRVNSGQVRTFVESGSTREEATLRIQATAPVDEPVVTLYLKAGCSQAVTRRFVILSEVPPESRSDSSAAANRGGVYPASIDRADGAVAGASVRVAGNQPASGSSGSSKSSASSGMGRTASSGDASEALTLSRPSPVRSLVRKAAPEKQAPKPRLKLDPVDLLIERDPVLRASTELLSEPQDGGTRRAEAAALWRAINASPEEILKDSHRLHALQADLALIQGQKQKDDAEMVALKSRLQTIEAESVGREWVFGLAVAFAMALGSAVFFWRRSRAGVMQQWWSVTDGSSDSGAAAALAPGEAGQTPLTQGAGKKSEPDIDLDVPPMPTKDGEPALAARPVLTSLDGVDFQSSLSGAGRAVKVDELLDVQQQADFFISLGQYEQAVAALRNHIADNVETSALAYLDLLKIYHLQGREKDFALVRKEFNDLFNAEVPEFASFDRKTRGLQSYQSALSRIEELWPTPKVLEVIEESILRKPGQGRQVFDLEAYRELLMLYAVAKDIVDDSRQGRVHANSSRTQTVLPERPPLATKDRSDRRSDFQSTNIQPLSVSAQANVGNADSRGMPLIRVPPSPKLGLDIDLSALVPVLPPVDPPVDPPIEQSATDHGKASKAKAPDSHLIDFDLFDLATKSHADSRRGKS